MTTADPTNPQPPQHTERAAGAEGGQKPERAGRDRPRRADARRNRDGILAAARAAFAAEGPDASLNEIARRAGVGPGTLYRHFPTRQALLAAVLADRVRRLCDRADQLVTGQSPAGALDGWLRALLDHARSDHGLGSAALTEAPAARTPAQSTPATEAPAPNAAAADLPGSSTPVTDAPASSGPASDAPKPSAPGSDAPTSSRAAAAAIGSGAAVADARAAGATAADVPSAGAAGTGGVVEGEGADLGLDCHAAILGAAARVLGNAQRAAVARADVTPAEMIDLVVGVALATGRPGTDPARPERLLALVLDALRP